MTRVLLRHYGPEVMFLLAAGWGAIGVWLLNHPRVATFGAVFTIVIGALGMFTAAYTRYDVGYGTPEVSSDD